MQRRPDVSGGGRWRRPAAGPGGRSAGGASPRVMRWRRRAVAAGGGAGGPRRGRERNARPSSRESRDQGGQAGAALDAVVRHAFRHNAVRLQLHALAYNLANFLRSLVLPREVEPWSLTTLREKLVKIDARIVRHGRYAVFQLAEVGVSKRCSPRSCVGSPPLPA